MHSSHVGHQQATVEVTAVLESHLPLNLNPHSKTTALLFLARLKGSELEMSVPLNCRRHSEAEKATRI